MQRRILQLEMSSKQADNFAADIPILRNESVPNLRVNQSNTDNILSQRNVSSDNNIRRAVVPNLSSKLNDVKEVSPNLWKLKIIDKLEIKLHALMHNRLWPFNFQCVHSNINNYRTLILCSHLCIKPIYIKAAIHAQP
ncbi:hypothetical protein HI914_04468 [Erysiphe necator]|nr:hypothetical protein HI914_04468 [Erysiphe necator]